jgi:hypothetical protein
VFHRILDLEQAAQLLCALADEEIVLDRAGHDAGVFWAAYAEG